MAGFWNAIGLPNAADIQNLTELCRQQAQRIETLENEVRQLREIVQTQAEQNRITLERTSGSRPFGRRCRTALHSRRKHLKSGVKSRPRRMQSF